MTPKVITASRKERSINGVVKVAHTALAVLRQSQQRRRSMSELRSMSDRDLEDIGLQRYANFIAVHRNDTESPKPPKA